MNLFFHFISFLSHPLQIFFNSTFLPKIQVHDNDTLYTEIDNESISSHSDSSPSLSQNDQSHASVNSDILPTSSNNVPVRTSVKQKSAPYLSDYLCNLGTTSSSH